MRRRRWGDRAERRLVAGARTSSFCSAGGCVGVSETPHGGFAVVDTKNGSVLRFTRGEWVEFVAGVKNNEFDAEG